MKNIAERRNKTLTRRICLYLRGNREKTDYLYDVEQAFFAVGNGLEACFSAYLSEPKKATDK